MLFASRQIGIVSLPRCFSFNPDTRGPTWSRIEELDEGLHCGEVVLIEIGRNISR